jgi:uncharacterized protein YfkK (UPF0435 family)
MIRNIRKKLKVLVNDPRFKQEPVNKEELTAGLKEFGTEFLKIMVEEIAHEAAHVVVRETIKAAKRKAKKTQNKSV